MSRFNFTGLLAVVKALHTTTTKDDIKAVIISDKVKNDTTIEFKNGSYIKILAPKGECARGNRSKIIYPLCNGDGTVDYHFDKEMLDEVLAPFCTKRENNKLDGQLLYATSNKKIGEILMKQKIKICKKYNRVIISKDFPKDFQPDPESDIFNESFIDTDSVIYKKLSKKGKLGKFLACLILFFKID